MQNLIGEVKKMETMGNLLILFTASLCLFLFYWWIPHRVQFIMNSQGIRGPPYEFIRGNNKEAAQMLMEASTKPMALTHDIFPRVMPHVYSWINKYGENMFFFSFWNMIPAVVASVETMLEKWKSKEGKEMEVFQEFRLLTSEVISRTAFGSSYLEGEKIFDMLMKLTVISCRNIYKFWKSADEIESDKIAKMIHDSVMKIVKKRDDKVVTGEADNFGRDFLGLLVNVYHEADEKNRHSIQDLVDECKTFYFSGQETVNSLLAWATVLLAIHSDWQDKARAEVIEVFDTQNSDSEGMAKLNTITMIINVTLRLYYPISDDVDLFKPERFAKGIAEATKYNAAAFMPFGLGPRSCVGMSFTIIQAKTALSMILQRYTINLSPSYVHAPLQRLTLKPQHGIQLLFHSLHYDT
ncbi:hypothetical protein GOBAR_AA28067 [Gossypium barbadense]|uniref:Cytochrome P450 CYP749A22-like n=1 Tax=Gossypium barbadense TaxID=3634 RepID=A0A2P5WNE1_GOSBA|nr:hypothetical protein GOBAR_AA28067 [Gossypium barbadense]